MALHVGHNCVPWDDCDVCGAKVEPPYRQRTDVCAMCGAGFTVCRCRHQLREWRENMAKLVGAYETIDHFEVNGWTVTLFRNVSHNGTQPHGSYSASVRENASENVLAFYGETREAVEREVLRIVGVSPLDAVTLVEENAALRRRLDTAHAALRLGMSHLKGHYPVPYKEAEVLATMQAAIDDANKKEKP
jgi:hypothetical protein